MKSKILCFLIISLVFLQCISVYADQSTEIVALADSITDQEQQKVLDHFGVKKEDVQVVMVSNKDERRYLEGKLPDSVIGYRAISCAYIKILNDGSGIKADVNNITVITEKMYINAMVTAGVKDAEVKVTAPFPTTGTGALTGIMMAFEKMTGEELPEENKDVANEEIVVTSQLGEEIGTEEAANLITLVKEEVVKQKATSFDDIKKIVIDISGKLDINLTDAQIKQLSELMEKISKLDLDLENLKNQLGEFADTLSKKFEENKGLLTQIWDFIVDIFTAIADFISGLFGGGK